jgi:hypothetical protein
MRSVWHPNVVALKAFFYSHDEVKVSYIKSMDKERETESICFYRRMISILT